MALKKISGYLITEILPPFFFGLLAFTFILLITRLLKLAELVVSRGVPLVQIGKLLSLIMPTFLELTVPMAFLLAVLLGLGRLSQDHEILAMKASGISPKQILWPIGAVAVLIALVTLLLTTVVRPEANLALKKELYNIAKTRVGAALKEKVFNDEFPGILIYVEELIPPGNTAQGILIVDNRERRKEDIILGKVALITADEQTNTLGLRLFDGTIYEREEKRPGFSQTRFNIYDFKLDFDELVGTIKRKDAAPKETSLQHLLAEIRRKQAAGRPALAERLELHQRFSFPFAPLIFGLLGVALTLLPRSSRASRSWGIGLAILWLVIYYALMSLGKAIGENGILHPFPAVWLPNVAIGTVALVLFRKAIRESPLYLQTKFESAVAWSGWLFSRTRQAH